MDKWLTQTNVIRVFSLLVGILLWVIVHLDEHVGDDPRSARDRVQDSWIYNLEVQVIGLDEERYRISSISPQTVNIVVRGTSANLAKISTRDGKSRIVADLSDVSPEEVRYACRRWAFRTASTSYRSSRPPWRSSSRSS
mgnify:CR=1 FL=1